MSGEGIVRINNHNRMVWISECSKNFKTNGSKSHEIEKCHLTFFIEELMGLVVVPGKKKSYFQFLSS